MRNNKHLVMFIEEEITDFLHEFMPLGSLDETILLVFQYMAKNESRPACVAEILRDYYWRQHIDSTLTEFGTNHVKLEDMLLSVKKFFPAEANLYALAAFANHLVKHYADEGTNRSLALQAAVDIIDSTGRTSFFKKWFEIIKFVFIHRKKLM